MSSKRACDRCLSTTDTHLPHCPSKRLNIERTIVLLGGGLKSAACLAWSVENDRVTHCLFVHREQLNWKAELHSARQLASLVKVPLVETYIKNELSSSINSDHIPHDEHGAYFDDNYVTDHNSTLYLGTPLMLMQASQLALEHNSSVVLVGLNEFNSDRQHSKAVIDNVNCLIDSVVPTIAKPLNVWAPLFSVEPRVILRWMRDHPLRRRMLELMTVCQVSKPGCGCCIRCVEFAKLYAREYSYADHGKRKRKKRKTS